MKVIAGEWRNPPLEPKTAFSCFPLVHRADLERQQRVASEKLFGFCLRVHMWWVSVNPKPEFDIRRFHSLRRLKHQNGLSNVVNDKGYSGRSDVLSVTFLAEMRLFFFSHRWSKGNPDQ
jgi:hypothetical protein